MGDIIKKHKIAFHREGSKWFSLWTNYCDRKGINYIVVNAYENDIVAHLLKNKVTHLFWHFNQSIYVDVLMARDVLFSATLAGIKTFPDFFTSWHFDDKVSQKYLLEAVGAPLVPSYVFYSKEEALNWVEATDFPKVFKLRRGAGGGNVWLINDVNHARHVIKRAFGRGIPIFNRVGNLKERVRKYRAGKDDFLGVIKGIARLFIYPKSLASFPRECGYVYFQDYIPNNKFDIRVVVIGKRAFAIKRMVRPNDFRASGSGDILYEKENFSNETIKLAFETAEKIKSQCVAFDFVYDFQGKPLIVEISYGFVQDGYYQCVGYWDNNLVFHEGKFIPQEWIIEDALR